MLRRERPFRSVNELTRVNGIAAARLRDMWVAKGMSRPLLKLGGGSVEILCDVRH